MPMTRLAVAALLAAGPIFATPVFAEEHAAPGKEAKHAEPAKEGHDAMPAGTKGVSEGTIVKLEKGKLILRTGDGDLLFAAHWRGGMPKDGGGLDQETVAALEAFKIGQKVRIAWTWSERRRIESIKAL
jgi:hypothetical protein